MPGGQKPVATELSKKAQSQPVETTGSMTMKERIRLIEEAKKREA